MSVRPLFLSGILTCLLWGPVLAGPPEQAENVDEREGLQKAITATSDGREQARLHKRLGDLSVAREDYAKASDEFMQALSLAPSDFSEQERLSMAITISWAGRYDDATAILRSILAQDPKNRKARIHLAQVLSWSGNLKEAEAEADAVLDGHPEDQEALLVKANALRWRGNDPASVPFYEKALKQGESFDARLGLAYAYLGMGEKKTAQEVSKTLKPLYPAQERELAGFSDALCGVQAPRLGVSYSYYYDSDKNTVNRAALLYGFWVGRREAELAYRLTDAKDPVRHEKAEDLGITAQAKAGRFDTGAGVGINRNGDRNLVTGQVRADTNITWGTIGVSAAREVLTDTAQLIENGIVRTIGTLNLSETVSPRFSFTESFIYSGYSDGNNAEDLWLTAQYAVTLSSPKITAGYRFRYLDFRRQSGSGYFDPEDFISNQVFVSLRTEKNGFYAYLQPSGGYQSYTRNGDRIGETFYSIFASAGWTMRKCTSFELYGEGGNYAGGTVAGFNYYQVGFRLTAYF
jgi:tetratricopeptide (TPR) repeat protein